MSQHDYVVDNGSGLTVRGDFNNALLAIVSNNSGATEPTATYAYMWWLDTTNAFLKIRNAGDTAWLTVARLTTSGFVPIAAAPQALTPDTAGDVDWDLGESLVATLDLDDAYNLNEPTNAVAGTVYRLILNQTVTGGAVPTFDAYYDFGDLSPSYSTAVGSADVLTFLATGSSLLALTFESGYAAT